MAELINDLTDKFLESYEDGHERSAVAEYGHYFLGSVIISDKEGQKFIIDGQQRLTTLTYASSFFSISCRIPTIKGRLLTSSSLQRFGKTLF